MNRTPYDVYNRQVWVKITDVTPGSGLGPHPTASGNRVARGGTQGGLNCLTHVLPRCLLAPTEEAGGGGGRLTGRLGRSGVHG